VVADNSGAHLVGGCAIGAGEQHGSRYGDSVGLRDHSFQSVNGSETIRTQRIPEEAEAEAVNKGLMAAIACHAWAGVSAILPAANRAQSFEPVARPVCDPPAWPVRTLNLGPF
jgi:hypothetical protein